MSSSDTKQQAEEILKDPSRNYNADIIRALLAELEEAETKAANDIKQALHIAWESGKREVAEEILTLLNGCRYYPDLAHRILIIKEKYLNKEG